MADSRSPLPETSYRTYEPGQVLNLNVEPGFKFTSSKLRVRVKRIHQPWTLSSGMIVDILDSYDKDEGGQDMPTSTAFLKLYDRRHAYQLRKDNGIQPWKEDIEDSCGHFVATGRAGEFFYKLRNDEGFKEAEEETWDDAENEAFLADHLRGLFEAEIATYSRLRDHQGQLIPRLLAAVSLDITPPEQPWAELQAADAETLFQVKGVLLEYLNGHSLATLEKDTPRSSWQAVVDQAVKIVHVLDDHDVLNTDVRPDNFIIVPSAQDGLGPQVFMIDLAQCRSRRKDESLQEWGRAKWIQDEEGAVGLLMKRKLGRSGFELNFKHSYKYLDFAEREDESDSHRGPQQEDGNSLGERNKAQSIAGSGT